MSGRRHPIFGETQEQHNERLEAVLTRLEEAHVTLNPEKWVYFLENVEFLEHVVGKDGVQVDSSKVEAVSNMSEPTDVRQLRRFLGIVNQVGQYIKNLEDSWALLTKLGSISRTSLT